MKWDWCADCFLQSMAVRCMTDIRSRKAVFNGKIGAIEVAGIEWARAEGTHNVVRIGMPKRFKEARLVSQGQLL